MSVISYAGQYDASAASSAHVDPVARTYIAQKEPVPGTSIEPGRVFWAAGKLWKNKTTAAITIPLELSTTALKSEGFYEMDEYEAGIADISFDSVTNTLRTRFLDPNHPDIVTDLSNLDEYVGSFDTYNDLPPESIVLGATSIVTNSIPGYPKGIYEGNGVGVSLVLSDDTNVYNIEFTDIDDDLGTATLDFYENEVLVKQINFPFRDFKVHQTVLEAIGDLTTVESNTLYFVDNPNDQFADRGLYYSPINNTDANNIMFVMSLPVDRDQFFDAVELYDDITDVGKLDKVLSIVTKGDDTHPPGLYVGDGNDAVLVRAFHEASYRGMIEQYDDATSNHLVEGTITVVSIGNRDNPRGIYESVRQADGTQLLELVLELSDKPTLVPWVADETMFDAGDLFVMPDLYAMEAPRIFRVPASWVGGTDETGADWDITEQNRYESLNRDLPFPIGSLMVEEVVTVPYPTADSTWAIDLDNHLILRNIDDVWKPFHMESVADGARINVKDDSRNWYYDAPTSEIVLIPPPPAHVYLHHVPVDTIDEMTALQLVPDADDTVIFVNDTKQMFRYHNTNTTYWNDLVSNGFEFNVFESDDGNGVWVEEYNIEYKPLQLRPVDNIAAMTAIYKPGNGSTVRVENIDTVYEYYKGDVADLPGEVNDDNGDGAWHPIDEPNNYPHLRLDPVDDITALKAIEAEDFAIVKVKSQDDMDNSTGLTNKYVFKEETAITVDTAVIIADDAGTGNWYRVAEPFNSTFVVKTIDDFYACPDLPYQELHVNATGVLIEMPTLVSDRRVFISSTADQTDLVIRADQLALGVQFINEFGSDDEAMINTPYYRVELFADAVNNVWRIIT